MAIGDFIGLLDSQAFVQAAYEPPILRKRTKNVVLLLSSNPENILPHLRSIAITDAGLINTTPLGSLDLGATAGRDMGLIHWVDDIFVAYANDQNADARVWSAKCTETGTLTEPFGNVLLVGQASTINRQSDLIKPHDGILLTGPSYPYPGVHLQTVAITDAGLMPDSITEEMDLPVRPRTQRLRQGAGARIINLSASTAEFYIDSFTCSSMGVLPDSPDDSWGPITCINDHKSLCKISDTVFAIFTIDADGPLKIYTFSINPDGTINKSWKDFEQVEAASLEHLHMTEMGGGYFVLAYTMADPNWRLRTCSIAGDGTITLLDSKDIATGNRGNPFLEHLQGNIWTFTYEDVSGSVRIDTIEISTPGAPAELGHTELIMGIGP
ncbi:hypothetical protein ES703_19468 [subsurface metagenome]